MYQKNMHHSSIIPDPTLKQKQNKCLIDNNNNNNNNNKKGKRKERKQTHVLQNKHKTKTKFLQSHKTNDKAAANTKQTATSPKTNNKTVTKYKNKQRSHRTTDHHRKEVGGG
jgi:hypothetical protein